MKDITIVLMTCGEETERECLAAVKPFLHHVEFAEVRNVCPQIKALNQMIDLVQTEFFIPLDSDMILDQDAWPRIRIAVDKYKHDQRWHSILFHLWDTLTERQILALKILRSKIAKTYPFKESPTPDVEHYTRLTDLGFTCIHDFLSTRPIGKHVVRGHHFCYNKYRDVYQTYRTHNFAWDSGAFMGGTDLMTRAKSHFDFFLFKWITTDEPDYLSCIAGMVDGITSPVEYKSKTLAKRSYKIRNEEAFGLFMEWFLEQKKLSEDSSQFIF